MLLYRHARNQLKDELITAMGEEFVRQEQQNVNEINNFT